jgi:hypothetical protein
MSLGTRRVIYSYKYQSNAAELEGTMSKQAGVARVISAANVPMSWSTTYSQPPLCLAARIARLMHSDFRTRRILHYHQRAVMERADPSSVEDASWFISLYKVRDFFSKVYEEKNKKIPGEKKIMAAEIAQKALGITSDNWKYFGQILNNNDLRHAEISGTAPPVSGDDVAKLYTLALSWVASYLRTKGIPALPAPR